jgi:hypothetical protein
MKLLNLISLGAAALLVLAGLRCTSPDSTTANPDGLDPAFVPVVRAIQDTTVAINDTVFLWATNTNAKATIDTFEWAFDGDTAVWVKHSTISDSSGTLKRVWEKARAGIHSVQVKCHNTLGQWSLPVAFKVNVMLYPPKIKSLRSH